MFIGYILYLIIKILIAEIPSLKLMMLFNYLLLILTSTDEGLFTCTFTLRYYKTLTKIGEIGSICLSHSKMLGLLSFQW